MATAHCYGHIAFRPSGAYPQFFIVMIVLIKTAGKPLAGRPRNRRDGPQRGQKLVRLFIRIHGFICRERVVRVGHG